MEQQVKQVMADVLNLDPATINGSTSRDRTASWDSLNHINLVVALEQEFQVSFEVSEIEAMLSYMDILEILEQKPQS